jgi:origin recognition complex subunit 1
MVRINFQPYTTPQLEKIVQARLQSAKDDLKGNDADVDVITADGVKFAAMKVSSISGDARRVLDICRHALVPPFHSSPFAD